MSIFEMPAHIPPELVKDFDFLRADLEGDFYDSWRKLQEDGPDIFYSPQHGGHWVLTRYEDIEHVMSTYDEFSSRYQTLPKEGHPFAFPPIESDPPLHTDFRRLIAPFFSPKSISELEVKARNLTISLINELQPRGECDFPRDFALHMPIAIFMWMAGLPAEDRLFVLGVAEGIVRGDSERHRAASLTAFEYLGRKIEERRQNPGNDLISATVQGVVEGGRHLTQEEMLGMATLLLVGGLDTVAAMLGFFAYFLARNPGDRRRLVDNPGLINNAVEELMRRFHIANVARVVVKDMVFRGVTMKAGDMVLTATSFAGLDEHRYPHAMQVDFDRGDKKSLVFGRGPHQCIGAFLARTELRVFLTEWLKRIPEFSIKPGETPSIMPGRANAITYLPLVWPLETR